jgi:nucleotide-binding universal stress UspA family protein
MATPKFRSVLAATDLSEFGNHVVPYAYAIAARAGVVHLLHVIEPVIEPSPLYAHYEPITFPTPEERAREKANVAASLRALAPGDAAARDIKTRPAVVEAKDVVEAILAEGDRVGANVICVSSHGRTGIVKAVLGSIAQDVVSRSHRPVLVVRPPSKS